MRRRGGEEEETTGARERGRGVDVEQQQLLCSFNCDVVACLPSWFTGRWRWHPVHRCIPATTWQQQQQQPLLSRWRERERE